MNERTRFVAGGAALGAIVGALIGLIAARSQANPETGEPGLSLVEQYRDVDRNTVFRLGMSVVGVVRQILELL